MGKKTHVFLTTFEGLGRFCAIEIQQENETKKIERYADYGPPVLRTDQRGTIEFITDGQLVWVETTR